MSISIDTLCQPISASLPSGEDLEYSPEYLEMDRLFWAEKEMAIEVWEEEEPDWKEVQKRVVFLQERTRDLRVQVYATIATLHTGNIFDFRDNLKVLVCYLRDFWCSVYPQLDSEDDHDLTLRKNILQMLNDYSVISRALVRVKLDVDKGRGQFGVRDIKMALYDVEPWYGEKITDLKVIHDAFKQSGCKPDSFTEAINVCVQLLTDLEDIWGESTDDYGGLLFNVAKAELLSTRQFVVEFAAADTQVLLKEAEIRRLSMERSNRWQVKIEN